MKHSKWRNSRAEDVPGADGDAHTALPYGESSIFIRDGNSRFRFASDGKSEESTFVGFIGTPDGAFMVEGRRIKKSE